jgi:hypothetical protein
MDESASSLHLITTYSGIFIYPMLGLYIANSCPMQQLIQLFIATASSGPQQMAVISHIQFSC